MKQIIQITKVLKRRINRLAHIRAQRYAQYERDRLIDELSKLAAKGADLYLLHARLDAVKQQPWPTQRADRIK